MNSSIRTDLFRLVKRLANVLPYKKPSANRIRPNIKKGAKTGIY